MKDSEGAVVLPAITKAVVHKVGPEPGSPLPAADDVAHPENKNGKTEGDRGASCSTGVHNCAAEKSSLVDTFNILRL